MNMIATTAVTGKPENGLSPLRSDAMARHAALCRWIEEEVKSAPSHFDGHSWAGPVLQSWLAHRFGITPRTLRSLAKVPPVVSVARGRGRNKATYYRLGELDPVDPAKRANIKTANVLSKHWRAHRGEAMTTHRDYGLLFGLVEAWPEGWQVRIFAHVLTNWSAFCAMAKLEIAAAQAYAGQDPFAPDLVSDNLLDTARRLRGVPLDAGRRYRHVSLSFLRRFAHIAPKLLLLDLEERGDGKAVALRAMV